MKKTILTALLFLVALTGQAQKFVDQLADTYWRNEATGDWLIGFTQKHVIYNNKVWNITNKTEKKVSDDSGGGDVASQIRHA